MTNKEAIDQLNIILESAEKRARRNIEIPLLVEALKKAIKALKREQAWEEDNAFREKRWGSGDNK